MKGSDTWLAESPFDQIKVAGIIAVLGTSWWEQTPIFDEVAEEMDFRRQHRGRRAR